MIRVSFFLSIVVARVAATVVVLTTGTSSGAGSGSEVLQRVWNNFAYQGDPLPVGDALNDAAPEAAMEMGR